MSDQDFKCVKTIVWGSENAPENCLKQWEEPFIFSELENSALVQHHGGPCAVLAPIQAQLIQTLLLKNNNFSRTINSAADLQALMSSGTTNVSLKSCLISVLHQVLSRCTSSGPLKIVNFSEENLSVVTINSAEKLDDAETSFDVFFQPGGVLNFVYSIILTRESENIKADLGLQSDPLIESVHGHGSVALTNLCLIGKAVPNMFDDNKDLGGLVLNGISETPDIGYLSLMEHFRYIEVGHRMKNPKYPIWLLSSETHLTVLCSTERNLCSAGEELTVKQAFAKLDSSGNGFIQEGDLSRLLKDLQLPDDDSSLAAAKSELDSEDLGIITLGAIMLKYFPHLLQANDFEVITDVPFMQYNGLNFKTESNTVTISPSKSDATSITPSYSYGVGVIGLGSQTAADSTKLELILATKWPAIQINWSVGSKPSVDWI